MRVSTRDNNFINSKGDDFVSISGSGDLFVITVSTRLASIAGLKDKVILEYDDAERRLYIKPLAIADKGALNVKKRQIGATGFFRYAGISPDKGRYKAFYDPQSGEIAVPLE